MNFGAPYWFDVSGMGRYTINDSFNVATRAEYVYDKSGGYLVSVPGTLACMEHALMG